MVIVSALSVGGTGSVRRLVGEQELADLADARARELVEQRDLVRTLGLREVLLAPRPQRI
jgi:hypothetical protein